MKNGTIVYHCKRTSAVNAEYETFAKPIPYRLRLMYLTIQPNTGNVYDSTFGEFRDYTHKMCGMPYAKWDNEIKEGDRFYVDMGAPDGYNENAEPEYGWGYDANYRVERVAKQNIAIFYALKSLVEDSRE